MSCGTTWAIPPAGTLGVLSKTFVKEIRDTVCVFNRIVLADRAPPGVGIFPGLQIIACRLPIYSAIHYVDLEISMSEWNSAPACFTANKESLR